ncbi:hypothetical protein EDC96DRAFT_540574 [Choanephora cucurbitarum]|nr:hypothetical protein EDC96DRAFT_540574 [Choanephora cucurbitarum]
MSNSLVNITINPQRLLTTELSEYLAFALQYKDSGYQDKRINRLISTRSCLLAMKRVFVKIELKSYYHGFNLPMFNFHYISFIYQVCNKRDPELHIFWTLAVSNLSILTQWTTFVLTAARSYCRLLQVKLEAEDQGYTTEHILQKKGSCIGYIWPWIWKGISPRLLLPISHLKECLLEEATDIMTKLQEHKKKLVEYRFSTPPSETLEITINPSILNLTEESDKVGMHLLGPFFTNANQYLS